MTQLVCCVCSRAHFALSKKVIYRAYSAGRVEAVKHEKAERSAFKSELNTDKRKVVKELEKVAIGQNKLSIAYQKHVR